MSLAMIDGSDISYQKADDLYKQCKKGGTITIPSSYHGWVAAYCDLNKQVVQSGRDVICIKK